MLRVRDFSWIACVLIVFYFLLAAWPGLEMKFSTDDLNNIYRYWDAGWGKLAGATMLVATPFYRPLGGLFYLPLFEWFGFNPLPYRIVSFLIVALNVALLYAMVRPLWPQSRFPAALAVLAGWYHSAGSPVLYNNAMIYELLCLGFTAAALGAYARKRSPLWPLVFFACALNAKEMAVGVPVLFALYEWLYRRERQWRTVILSSALAIAYTAAKMLGPGSLATVETYRPEYSLARVAQNASVYTGYLLDTGQPAARGVVIVMWGGLLAYALAARRRATVFGVAFTLLLFLPLAFVPSRQGFVVYMPVVGLAIVAADAVEAALTRIRTAARLSPATAAQTEALVFVACFMLLVGRQIPHAYREAKDLADAEKVHWEIVQEVQRVNPDVPAGGKVMIESAPLESGWDGYFLAKLFLDNPRVRVSWRANEASTAQGDFHEPPDVVWHFDAGRLVVKPR